MVKGPVSGFREDRIDSFYNFDLRNARIGAGYTIKQMAGQVGVSLPAYNTYERLRVTFKARGRKVSFLVKRRKGK